MSERFSDTFPRLLQHQAAVRGEHPAMRAKDLGIWQSWTWGQVCEEVHALACGLAELGFKRGDNLAIIGDNRPRLYWAMAAAQCLGEVPVPMYQDAVARQRQADGARQEGRMKPMALRAIAAWAMFALCALAARADEVPYIRTPQVVVDKMLELAEVGPEDFLIDLGSGDGRIVITAAQKRGARGFGVELDTSLVESSNEAARKAGVAERARFFDRDLFDTDIREASVLTMYLLPEVNLQLRPRILAQLKPGTRVVSHDWDMGEWQPDAKAVLEGLTKPVMPIHSSTVYLWIVPARVAGIWSLQVDGAHGQEAMALEFTQRFQEISGVVRRTRGRTLLQSAHLRGPEIRFAVIDEARRPSEPVHFFGRVFGDAMEGTTGAGQRWRAQRKAD